MFRCRARNDRFRFYFPKGMARRICICRLCVGHSVAFSFAAWKCRRGRRELGRQRGELATNADWTHTKRIFFRETIIFFIYVEIESQYWQTIFGEVSSAAIFKRTVWRAKCFFSHHSSLHCWRRANRHIYSHSLFVAVDEVFYDLLVA